MISESAAWWVVLKISTMEVRRKEKSVRLPMCWARLLKLC